MAQVQGQEGMGGHLEQGGRRFPSCEPSYMAQQGIEVLGWDDWAQADVHCGFRLDEGQASRRYPLGAHHWQGVGC